MLITPGSKIAGAVLSVDRGPPWPRSLDNDFSWQIRRLNDRQSRRDLYEIKKRGYEIDPLVRAKLVTVECKTDKDFLTMEVRLTLTKAGQKAVDAVKKGLVFDTKLQQVTFSATSEFYLDCLRAQSVSSQVMALAQKLPRRYKDVHKAILLRQLFSTQDAKGNWIKVDLY